MPVCVRVENKLKKGLYMAAPKGNNYSALRKTHPTYTDDEIAKICDDLLEWAHTDDGLFLDSYVYETYKRPSS